MKKIFVTLLIAVSGFSIIQANPFPETLNRLPQITKDELLHRIDYSNFVKHANIEGEVLLKLVVNQNNSLELAEINSNNPELSQYVKKRLELYDFHVYDSLVGKEYLLKISFIIR